MKGDSIICCDCRRYYAEVKETFAALLDKADVRMPHLTSALAGLLAKRLAGGGEGNAPAAASREDSDLASRLLMRIFSVDDVIYKKVRAHVHACMPMQPLPHLQPPQCCCDLA
jgi:hypothetical protein